MAKSLDIGFAVRARQVADRYVDDSQAQNGGRVEQLKIAERIEVAEIAPPRHHAPVIETRNEFRPAERIADANIQNPAERFCEENISQPVEKAHGVPFHRVHQPRTVNEIAEALAIGFVEAPQHFGRHGQVRVQNDEKRLGGMRKTESYRIRLAFSGLLQRLNSKAVAITCGHALDLLPRSVARMPFHKNDFGLAAEARKTLERIFDVAALVACRNDAGDSRPGLPASRAQNNDIRQA